MKPVDLGGFRPIEELGEYSNQLFETGLPIVEDLDTVKHEEMNDKEESTKIIGSTSSA